MGRGEHFDVGANEHRVEHQGPSPLDYSSSSWVQPERLAVVNPDAGEHPKGDFGFSELRSVERYGKSGKALKKPREKITPGAAPGTTAFVDYSRNQHSLDIHYMKTRKDQQGQGLATHLASSLVRQHPDVSVNWGKVMNEGMDRVRQRVEAQFPDRKFHHKRYF